MARLEPLEQAHGGRRTKEKSGGKADIEEVEHEKAPRFQGASSLGRPAINGRYVIDDPAVNAA
jgi:hypothetical protein